MMDSKMFATAKRQTFNGRDVLAHLAYTHAPSTASESGRKDKKKRQAMFILSLTDIVKHFMK